MIILGLTGSIAMGKSTAAATLRRLGVPIYDADAEVHRLLAPGGAAVEKVAAMFPNIRDAKGGIDRQRLGQQVFGNAAARRQLEGILHPLIRRVEKRIVAQARVRREPVVVLDIPLLFETGSEERCDLVLVVSAPARLQRERALRRPGMNGDRLAGILRAQLPDREKRRRADFVVATALGRGATFRRLRAIVRKLRDRGTVARSQVHRKKVRRCARS